jgi:YbbR domain-containing protein
VEGKNKEGQILIKICCVIFAFILWLYIFNVENPMTERKIVVPVTIVNEDVLAQSKLTQVGNDQFSVSLIIRGNASDVYSVKSSDFKLNSDFSSYVMKKGENNIPVIVKKSPDNISIVNIENLWIKVQLDELKKKSVPVRVTLTGKPKEGYYAFNPVLNMEKAEVSGAQEPVSTVKYVVATYNVKDAQKDINTSVTLQAEDGSGNVIKEVSVNPSVVKITVPVGKMKTVPVNVKIQGNTGASAYISVTALPEKVGISGDESIIKNINEIDTEPVDLSKIGDSDSSQVKLVVPQGVKLVNNSGIVQLRVNSNEARSERVQLASAFLLLPQGVPLPAQTP